MLEKILVGFDGSEPSFKAFHYGLEIIKQCSVTRPQIVVVSVVQLPEPADIVEVEAVIDSATEHYKVLFAELENRAKTQQITIATEVLVGHPADQIIRYAKGNGVDLILVGQMGKSKIENWLLGSVSRRVAAYSHCTVTIVK